MKSICKLRNKALTFMALTGACILLFAMTAFAETKVVQEIGPGVPKITVESQEIKELAEGTSLGIFTTSGYCNCDKCSGGHNLTYNGTVPQAEYTISADLTVLPLGSKVRIGDIIYTVEDKGSSVSGNKLDIFYASHEEAWAHGLQEVEVFLIEKADTAEETIS